MAAVAVSAVVSIAAEGKDRETRHFYYRIAWASAGTVAIVVLLFRAQVFEAIGKSPDMTGRSGIWKKVLGLIEERPLEGWGWISHWVPGVKPYEGLVVIKNVPYYQAHNAYLDVALQLGLIGALVFGVFLLITFVKLWRLAVRHTSALYLWPILVFMGLAVWSLTESRLLIESGWLILALFAIKVFDPEDNLEVRGRTPKRVRLLARGLLRNLLPLRKDH
jgi:O-antigen ligase